MMVKTTVANAASTSFISVWVKLLCESFGERVLHFLFGRQTVNDGKNGLPFVVIQLFYELDFFHECFIERIHILENIFGNKQVRNFDLQRLCNFFNGREVRVSLAVLDLGGQLYWILHSYQSENAF